MLSDQFDRTNQSGVRFERPQSELRRSNPGDGAERIGLYQSGVVSYTQYLHNKPVDLLIGPELVAEDFNDDSLGRSLDQLFEAGVTEVFAQVAAHALDVYSLEHRFYHLDSSSFHLHGQYLTKEAEIEVIKITYG